MAVAEAATRMVIFLREEDRVGHRRLYEVIVERAREEGMAGATVWRGIEGFGFTGRTQPGGFPGASGQPPIAVEVLDAPERVEAFLGVVRELAPHCFVIWEPVLVAHSSSSAGSTLDDPVLQL
ncbi:MAG: DUF190 domain-containing protein [Actinomycetota bacterium]|nr:DUF190 domain-containing protein [Actinomycetota bacterium]